MVDVCKEQRPTPKVLMMTGTQKHQHEQSNLQEPQLSSAETTPAELDEAEKEGNNPFGVEFAKELYIQLGRERLQNSEGETQTPCPSNPGAAHQKTHTNQLDLLATELKDLQRTDDSIEAVRQAASVQPSTCICVQLHTLCVHLELHCCLLNAAAY